ncbi:MAG: hypothetical protein ACR2ID_06715 [Chthoniobacterales bacterium]
MILLALLLVASGTLTAAPLEIGGGYNLSFQDVDGKEIATAAGHVTIITVVTREQEAKAHAVADLVPERYVGDPKYRYVTMVNFEGKLVAPLRGITRAIIRRRLDAEAQELKPQYETKKLKHEPRKDLLVVPDFDGSAVTRLGLPYASGAFTVFVFDGRGKLVARWNEVPPGDALPKALAAAAP